MRCPAGPIRLLSLCAGDARDVLDVLATHERSADVTAVLVETDPVLTERARASVASLPDGAGEVDVRTADAGEVDVWADVVPAQVVLACGVFGNLERSQVERCISTLPVACARGASLLWTRGRGPEDPGPDLDRWLRRQLASNQVGSCGAGTRPLPRRRGHLRRPGAPARTRRATLHRVPARPTSQGSCDRGASPAPRCCAFAFRF